MENKQIKALEKIKKEVEETFLIDDWFKDSYGANQTCKVFNKVLKVLNNPIAPIDIKALKNQVKAEYKKGKGHMTYWDRQFK